MNSQKNIRFDLYIPKMKAQTQGRVFESLATEVESGCGVQAPVLMDIFQMRLAQRTFGMGDGVAIFDVKSSIIKAPVMVLSTLDQDVDFDALDAKPVDIMAAVISPADDVSSHLQKLAGISRMLKNDSLCHALREARDADAMRVLFMPTQDWMVAA